MEPACDRVPHGLDPEAAVRAEQVAAIEHRQGTDVRWPDLIRPQHELVLGGQPLDRHFLVSGFRVAAIPDAGKGPSTPLIGPIVTRAPAGRGATST